jgi:hypothetical protein
MGRRRARMRDEEITPAPVQMVRTETAQATHTDPLSNLQHTLGNHTLNRMLRGTLQRAIPEQAAFVRNSDLGKLYPRSNELKALDRALGAYEAVRDTGGPAELQALANLLNAVITWRESKADADTAKRWPFVNSVLQEVKRRFEAIVNEHREAWASGHFSDPALHDPSQYQYIINSIVEYNGPGETEPAYITEKLNDPAKIQNQLLSLSVITNMANTTWGPSGYIVQAPKENIYASKSSDLGTANSVTAQHESHVYRELVRLFMANGLPMPKEVLQGMKKHFQSGQYYEQNEIAAMGLNRVTQKAAEVTGIFVITGKGVTDPLKPITLFEQVGTIKEGGQTKRLVKPVPAVSSERLKLYVDLAKKYNLPLIALPLADTSSYKLKPGKPGPWAADMVLASS